MSVNLNPEGPGFRLVRPLEDRDETVPLPRVRTAPAPIMAAPADLELTAEHRQALDTIGTLASAARTHLTVWDSRQDDSDRDAAAAMGQAIKAVEQIVKAGRELTRELRLEDAFTAVEDGREAYQIRRLPKAGI